MTGEATGGLPPRQYLGVIADVSARAARVDADSLDRAVPSCPGWTVADVVWHLIEAHSFWRQVVADGADPSNVTRSPRPGDDVLTARFVAGAEALLDVLAASDPSTTVWTWTGPQPAAWVMRRMAHETSVHALDIGAVTGIPVSTAAEVAADGIDEFVSTMIGLQREGRPRPGGSVHVHCTDTAGEWLIQDRDGTFVVTREHAKGSCALRGEAAAIMSVLWRRAPLSSIEVFGDSAVAERFVGLVDLT